MRRRVGILVASLSGGGAERQAALWAAICADAGDAVTVLALWQAPDEFPLPEGVEVRYVRKRHALDAARMVGATRALARDSDVVVAFQPYCALLCRVARVGVPVVAVTGEDPRRFGDQSRVPTAALRAGLAGADLRTAPTQGIVDCHRKLGIAAAGRWLCVPNVADAAAFDVEPEPRRGAVFVGRLVPEKDPLLALEVADAAGVELTVLGDGPLLGEVERRARASRAPVELLGFVADPWPYYARARACLVTSHYEAFGNMLVESLAAGTPVVAGDCDYGPREVLGGAVHSRVVARERDVLAEALAEVAEGPLDEAAAAESRAIAARYRPEAVAPLVERALELALAPE